MILEYFSILRPKTMYCMVFCGENMCPGKQRKSRIRVTASVKNVSTIDVP